MDKVSIIWDYLEESGIATKDELSLITHINGWSIETLEDVIYARTGFNSYEQLIGEDEEEEN